jgi:predicted NBD/HSP70 family sugar kinase
MVGLDIRDTTVVAVLVDEGGSVRKRAEAGGDLAVAAVTAVEGATSISGESRGPAAIGLAAANPDAQAMSRVLPALMSRFQDVGKWGNVIASGTAAAIAESWIGAARDVPDVVYFAVAEHAIAGVIREGRPMMGANGRAPAVAWLSLNPVEREDYRKTGCVEAEVAAAGIVRRLIWRIKAGDHSRVRDAVNGELSAITVDHVLNAARERDGVSISVIRDTAKYLGMAAANLVAIADPHVLVLGGIMASAAELLLDPIRAELARRLPGPMNAALKVTVATLDSDAAAIGAGRYASTLLP